MELPEGNVFNSCNPLDVDEKGIVIEAFCSKYQEAVVRLILGIQKDEFAIPIGIEQQPDLLQIESFYQQNAGGFWLAKDGEVVVGSIGLLDVGGEFGVVRKMFVAADYRGKEKMVAVRLLNVLKERAKNCELPQIFLGTVDAFQAAQRFYVREGFVEIQDSELPKNFPRMAVDTKFYRFDLEVEE